DIVETPKGGPIFYEKIFMDAGVRPGDAIVVDDTPKNLAMATEVGATVIQSCFTGAYKPKFPLHYYHSCELLDLILDLANVTKEGSK
ncbi:MAG: hypothetical protein ACFFB3_22205, partial [Candidatus Hodarchaeota archaeon]